MLYNISNEELTVSVDSSGAEIRSVKDKSDYEYMWQADPTYWKRTSPVLFPLVGNYKDKESVYNGKTYVMSQHGFARDMEFQLVDSSKDSIVFRLEDNEDTLKKYPFKFMLEVEYVLNEKSISVNWRVSGKDEDVIYFSIGAHPAFNCTLEDSYLTFSKEKGASKSAPSKEKLVSYVLNSEGLITSKTNDYALDDGKLHLSNELFAGDALVIEDIQARSVSLFENDKRIVTVDFDAPLFGLWSPAGKNAPFMCIEPWYGRADGEDFDKTLENRKYGNMLKAGDVFEEGYTMTF
ncbi:MAG: aldose 1-epimerase family protein [Butyrivibrio sp.]|uniref:aldose 1-epimerase family protein n=1 Tax=Butyrivibrio sp. TaxID=28121 RepID=UPI0025EAED09|nr:aldose 1-epimerase family protein [Butyrivibrio sp.]MCR5770474.1 aldose 1-epimerase family protein [Butyrivibrio sp.]